MFTVQLVGWVYSYLFQNFFCNNMIQGVIDSYFKPIIMLFVALYAYKRVYHHYILYSLLFLLHLKALCILCLSPFLLQQYNIMANVQFCKCFSRQICYCYCFCHYYHHKEREGIFKAVVSECLLPNCHNIMRIKSTHTKDLPGKMGFFSYLSELFFFFL